MENESKTKSSIWVDKGTDFTRVLALSDGVFAIALTLLALELIPAEIDAGRVAQELPGVILGLIPQFLVFALAFYLVIVKWMAHRRIFEHITHYDSTLLWLNNWFLLLIAFMPVPAAILGRYPQEPLALIFFGVAQIITTAVQWLLWGYATRGHRFVDESVDDDTIRFFRNRYLIQIITFVVFTLVALINVWLALGVLFLFYMGIGSQIFTSRQRHKHADSAET